MGGDKRPSPITRLGKLQVFRPLRSRDARLGWQVGCLLFLHNSFEGIFALLFQSTLFHNFGFSAQKSDDGELTPSNIDDSESTN